MNEIINSSINFIRHYLRLLGIPDNGDRCGYHLLESPNIDQVEFVRNAVIGGEIVVVFQPDSAFTVAFGVEQCVLPNDIPFAFSSFQTIGSRRRELRSFHEARSFTCSLGETVVVDQSGASIWLSVPFGKGFILLVGTDLASDLIRFRQGDSAQVAVGQGGALWGIAGERPNYLFEKQLEGLPQGDRQADYWAMLLARYIVEKSGKPLLPILPNGAMGAVIITGDDDQAYLEKYAEQLSLLGDTPITYFLHPLTRHTPKTLKSMFGKKQVDLGIHPDALEQPNRYAELLKVQCAWFFDLVKRRPISVRNHGFLNDGYWGHLTPWMSEGINFSSNIPGLDGRVLNGSLLPARVFFDGELTSHWSILTAIGDGVRFISGMTDEDAANCIKKLAQDIREEDIPGIIVLNLHPQNVGETKAMHKAALEVIESGFVAWTVRDCLEWFERIDDPERECKIAGKDCWLSLLNKIKRWLLSL